MKIITENLKEIKKFDDRKIFFLEREGFFKLWDMRKRIIKELIEGGINEKEAKKSALSKFFKIINPLKAPIKVISFSYVTKYSSVTDQKLILEKYLDKDFLLFKRKSYREMNKKIKKAKTEKEIQDIKNFYERRIGELERIIELIKKEPDRFELFYTSYLKEKNIKRPVVHFNYVKNGKILNTNAYLRQEVPNIVYDDILEISKKERDKIVEKRLSEMKNLFGKIYFKEKKEVD